MAIMPFIFDTSKGETPQSIARQRELAAQIMGQIGQRPARNVGEGWGNALASVGHGITANVMGRRANTAEREGTAGANSMFDSIVSGLTTGQPIPASSPAAGAPMATGQSGGGGDMAAYQNAIASIESAGSGDYAAVGPRHATLGRPLGRYQVMEANIGPWSEKHLGRRVSAEEFLQSPEIQDAIFNGEFGEYVGRFGPEGAAQAWFGGAGGVGKLDRKDSLGTSIGAYTDKFNRAMGGAAPQQVASLDPSIGMPPANAGAAIDAQMPPQAPQMPMPDAQQQMPPPVQPPNMEGMVPPQMAQQPPPQPQMAQTGGMPPQGGGPSLQELMQAASNPWLNDSQRSVINMMIEQQMQQQDPYRQMQLQKGQLGMEIDRERLNQLQNPGPPDPTDTMRNLEWRAEQAGLQPGTPEYNDFMVRGGAGPQVAVDARNMGSIPPGYRVEYDDAGNPVQMEPIPGGPVAREQQAEEDAAAAAQRNAADYGLTVTQDVGIARNYLDEIGSMAGADGIVGANLREWRAGIPGTPEYNMRQFVESAQSNIVLDTINRMRQTSSAGATGMGNMSERQMEVIRGVLGQWKPGLPVEDQRYILDRISNFYMDVQFGSVSERAEAVRDGRMTQEESDAIQELYHPETRDARGRRASGDQSGEGDAPQSGQVMDGYRFRGGDPSDPANWEPVN